MNARELSTDIAVADPHPHRTAALPGVWRLGLARGGIELKNFFRQKEAVIFTFSLPALLMVLLGSVFSDTPPGSPVALSTVFAGSIIGAGITSTSFVNLGTQVATDREDGTLKRLHGTPMPAAAYFLGKIVVVLVCSLAEAALLMVVGALLFDLQVPTDPARWLTFAWVFLLGITCSALLGIAISSIARSGASAAAVAQVPFLTLQFLSGVYIPISQLPDWMLNVGSVFPLRWIAQGFRSVFLPDGAARVLEPAGTWQHGTTALVLGAWVVVGLLLCLASFRWTDKRAG